MNGWPIVAWTSLLLWGVFFAVFAFAGSDEEGLRLLVRATARSALAFFLLAYTASALRRLWPSPPTRWLLRNRRQLGVSFGIGLAIHGLSIGMLALLLGDAFEASAATLALGGLAFALSAVMLATSFDRSAAWLGPRLWNRLHRFGMYWIWFIFTATLAPTVGHQPIHAGMVALLLGALALRLVARRARRAAPAGAPA